MRNRADDDLQTIALRARRLRAWSSTVAVASAYVFSIFAVCALVLHAADRIVVALLYDDAISRSQSPDKGDTTRVTVGPSVSMSKVLSDEWQRGISSDSFWRSSRRASPAPGPASSNSRSGSSSAPPIGWLGAPPAYDWFADPDDDERPDPPQVRRPVPQRTVCVRPCDGFFFPISYGSINLSRDSATCESRCPGAKLYVQRGGGTSGTDLDGYFDLSGQPYSKLKNANLFRTNYDASCKCRPQPWEPEAQERHRVYALIEQRRKGDKAAIAELKRIQAEKRAEAKAMRAEARAKRERRRRGLPEVAPEVTTVTKSAPVATVGHAPAVAPLPAPPPTKAAADEAKPPPTLPETLATGTKTPLKPLTGGSVPVASTAADSVADTENASQSDHPRRASKTSRRRPASHGQPRRTAGQTARPGRSWVSSAFGQ